MESIHLEVVTPMGMIYDGEANAVVLPGTKLDNRTQDCFVLEDDRVSVQTASRTPPPKEPHTHDFER